MNMRRAVFISLCLFWGTSAAHAADVESLLAVRGEELLSRIDVDLTGDGQKEIATASLSVDGVVVSIFREGVAATKGKKTGSSLVELDRSKSIDGENIISFEARDFIGSTSPQLLVDVREVTPDDTLRHIALFRFLKGHLVSIFEGTLPVGEIAPPGASTPRLSLGATDYGYRFEDLDGDSKKELAIRRDLKSLDLERPGHGLTRVVIGSKEILHSFAHDKEGAGAFRVVREKFYSYLLEVKPVSANASSQKLPIELERELGLAAVEKGVSGVFETTGSNKRGETPLAPLTREVAPHANWGFDGKGSTAWCEGAPGDGIGEWWQAQFASETPVQMVRILFGSEHIGEGYGGSQDIVRFKLHFSNGEEVVVDRIHPNASTGAIAGLGDFALAEERAGQQTLVVLERPIKTSSVRIEIDDVSQKKRSGDGCLTDAVFYAPRSSM